MLACHSLTPSLLTLFKVHSAACGKAEPVPALLATSLKVAAAVGAPVATAAATPVATAAGGNKPSLSLGYVSGDWRAHPVGRITHKLATAHPTERFAVAAVSFNADDQSVVYKHVRVRITAIHS